MRLTKASRVCTALLGGAALVWTGCAQVGPPLPPSANLPAAAADFQAVRSGPAVLLAWTPPVKTSDGVRLHAPVQYRVCVWPGNVAPAPPVPPPPRPPVRPSRPLPAPTAPQVPSPPPSGVDSPLTPAGQELPPCPLLLPLAPHPASNPAATLGAALGLDQIHFPGPAAAVATLALGSYNGRDQRAGWSAPVLVSLLAVPPPPQLAATLTPDGVRLAWTGGGDVIHIYRELIAPPAPPPPPAAPPSALPLGLGTPPPATTPLLIATVRGVHDYLDRGMLWGRQYRYWTRSAAGAGDSAVESTDSNVVTVAVNDIFPPPVPTGLQVVVAPALPPAPPTAVLSWNAVAARDLAGYNVCRQLPGSGAWEKRNATPLPTPVFQDVLPPAPAGVRYAVTAVDQTGNESQRSAPVAIPDSAGGGSRPRARP